MAKAQVGDLIRVVSVDEDSIGDYEIGDICEVKSVDEYVDGDVTVTTNGCYLYDEEFEIFRKAGEEDSDIMTPEQQVPPIDAPEYPEGTTFSPNGLFPIDKSEQDAVEHPNHYTQGRFETIEVIEEITQGYSDGYVAYCVGNALKYLARAPHKHAEPTEDLRKAAKYLEFAIGRLTQK